MRAWDTWLRYLDNHNKPLHGCVMFNVKDGNTIAKIYDIDGTPLPNPIITDVYGRTEHQVFIDEDVVAYFYSYIGSGIWAAERDIDISDDTKWQLQYTIENKFDIKVEIDGDYIPTVNTIEELRYIESGKVITLLGYYEAYDKASVNYYFDPESTEDDNGGAIISNGLLKGRWKLVRPDVHLDVRHYGVFPSNSRNMIDQADQIYNATVYANRNGLKLYFGRNTDTQDYIYYTFNDMTIYPTMPITVAYNVKFIDTNSTIRSYAGIAFEEGSEPHFENNDTVLYSDYAKSSWNAKEYYHSTNNSAHTFIIDSNAENQTLTEWTVEVNANVTSSDFIKCYIKGIGEIGSSNFDTCRLDVMNIINGCSFRNTKLTEDMFKNDITPIVSISDCTMDIDDFRHKFKQFQYMIELANDYYIVDYKMSPLPNTYTFSNKLGDRVLTNLYGNEITFSDSTIVSNFTFMNSTFNELTIIGNAAHTYTFKNCSATIKLSSTAIQSNRKLTFILENSSINFDDVTEDMSITANNSTISIKGNIWSLAANNTNINTTDDTFINSFIALKCQLNGNSPIATYQSVIKDTEVNVTIESLQWRPATTSPYYNNGSPVITCSFDNCIFRAHNRLMDIAINEKTKVFGNWTNCIGYIENAVEIGRTNIDTDDRNHVYTYKNNIGTMEMKTTVAITNIFEVTNPTDTSKDDILANAGIIGHAFKCAIWDGSDTPTARNHDSNVIFAASVYQNDELYDDLNRYFCVANMFQIGTEHGKATFNVTWNDESQRVQNMITPASHGDIEVICYVNNSAPSVLSQDTEEIYIPYECSTVKKDYVYDNGMWKIRNIRLGLGYARIISSSTNPAYVTLTQVF